MHNPEKLEVLKRARALSIAVHQAPLRDIGRRAPGLRSQLLRSIGSVPTNIVEGLAQPTSKAVARFQTIAINSANEAEHHLRSAYDLGVLGDEGEIFIREIIEIRRMIFGFRAHLLRSGDQKQVPAPRRDQSK